MSSALILGKAYEEGVKSNIFLRNSLVTPDLTILLFFCSIAHQLHASSYNVLSNSLDRNEYG